MADDNPEQVEPSDVDDDNASDNEDVSMHSASTRSTTSDNSDMEGFVDYDEDEFQFAGQMFPHGVPQALDVRLKCFSSLSANAHGQESGPDLDNGGKFILPPSILSQLTRLNITYPMLFHVINVATGRDSYCGVLEFIAPETICYAPKWMMKNLGLAEGAFVQITSATLPTATLVKLEPQSVDFLDITDPRAMLENSLRFFSTLTTGDLIGITYNDKLYELRVLETKPGPAVCCIECDMNVDFAPPVGYVEPERVVPTNGSSKDSEKSRDSPTNHGTNHEFVPFAGTGNRLDGKPFTPSPLPVNKNPQRGIPDYDWKVGTLTFFRQP